MLGVVWRFTSCSFRDLLPVHSVDSAWSVGIAVGSAAAVGGAGPTGGRGGLFLVVLGLVVNASLCQPRPSVSYRRGGGYPTQGFF